MNTTKSPFKKPVLTKAPSTPSRISTTGLSTRRRLVTSSSDGNLPLTLKHQNGTVNVRRNESYSISKGKENINVRPSSAKKVRKKVMDANEMLVGGPVKTGLSTPTKLIKSNSEMCLKNSTLPKSAPKTLTSSCTDLRTPNKDPQDLKANLKKKNLANMTPENKLAQHSISNLNSRISQLEEIEHSTKEELQATLQELTDLQEQFMSKQKENDELQKQLSWKQESYSSGNPPSHDPHCPWLQLTNTQCSSLIRLMDRLTTQCNSSVDLTPEEVNLLTLLCKMLSSHLSLFMCAPHSNSFSRSDNDSGSGQGDNGQAKADGAQLQKLKTDFQEAQKQIQELELQHQIEVTEWEKFKADLLTAVKVANDIKMEADKQVISLTNEVKTLQEQVNVLTTKLKTSRAEVTRTGSLGQQLEKKVSVKNLVQQVEKALGNNGVPPPVPARHRCAQPLLVQSPGEKKDPLSALICHGGSRRNALLNWVQNKLEKYSHVDITNFSTSWNDGMAFCALLHSYLPDKIDYEILDPKKKDDNFRIAFAAAESVNIPTVLNTADLTDCPDWKQVMAYVTSIYSHFEC